MQRLLPCSLLRLGAGGQLLAAQSFRESQRCVIRTLGTGEGSKTKKQTGQADLKVSEEDTDNLFHPDNIKDLSSLEIARLRVTYGLVKEHVKALERSVEAVDPNTNPMIDPRSFDIKKLPRLPNELLAQFRKDVPPDVAAESRPVSTKGVWEAMTSPGQSELGAELQSEHTAEWAIVDERTMEARQFARMQRQSLKSPTDASFRRDAPTVTQRRKKKICPLKDERGRVNVDFRAVGTLSMYLSDNGKILPKRRSGLSAKAQRKVARAVKTARTMALLDPEPKPRITVEQLRELEKSLK